jgi:polyisoprenoid-binding protein YceI
MMTTYQIISTSILSIMNHTKSSDATESSWKVDLIHSELSFKIKHLMISTLSGYIKSFDLKVQTTGSDFGQVTVLQLAVHMVSLTTHHEPRDEHLKSEAFFDVKNHPLIEFQSVSFEKQGLIPPSPISAYRRDYKLRGKLTIKDISKLVLLDGEFGGLSVGMDGETRAGFTVRGKLSREEFGLTWRGLTTAGKLLLSDEVEIVGNLQLIKQAA